MRTYRLNPLYWLSYLAFGLYAFSKDIKYIEKKLKSTEGGKE